MSGVSGLDVDLRSIFELSYSPLSVALRDFETNISDLMVPEGISSVNKTLYSASEQFTLAQHG
jgi:hypothetical protein